MVPVISETGTTRSLKQITKKKKKNKTGSLLHPIYKNNAQEITGLNVKNTTIKYLHQNIGEYLNKLKNSLKQECCSMKIENSVHQKTL